ncbi:MAG TPA: DUF4917 family protein [Candidatus Stercorousia faecigallinarum]|nr:DUF4917 family protein [Candidatus Stercorousia faecigallinarum]
MTYLTFDKAIEECNDYEKFLLLGNGFSRAFDEKSFDYSSLLDSPNIPFYIKKVFHTFHTSDFEVIIKKLESSAQLLNAYDHRLTTSGRLNQEANNLRDELINRILEIHPLSQNDIEKDRMFKTLVFLSNFNKIFTLNYDCLLYWALVNREDFLKKYPNIEIFKMDDGFRPYYNELAWRETETQNVFYLHGALHIYKKAYGLICKPHNDGRYLMDVIKDNIYNNKYPLIVTEGSSTNKLNKILKENNEYLSYCYSKLKGIKDVLFIHGHSLDKKDKHIFDAISKNSTIKRVYISLCSKEKYQEKREKADTFFANREREKTLEVFFYDAESANLW